MSTRGGEAPGRSVTDVQISDDMLAKIEQVRETKPGKPRRQFTPEEDAILLKYWPVKNHDELAQVLGCSTTLALRRYRELTKDQ